MGRRFRLVKPLIDSIFRRRISNSRTNRRNAGGKAPPSSAGTIARVVRQLLNKPSVLVGLRDKPYPIRAYTLLRRRVFKNGLVRNLGTLAIV